MSSLRTLRRLVGTKTGDVLVCTATVNAANPSSFSDIIRLADRGDNAPSIINRLLLFSTGLNAGHQAAVQGFSSDTRSITYAPASPFAPKKGDEIELWSVAERIGSISGITGLINLSIDCVKDIAGLEDYSDSQILSLANPTLSIPQEWCEFGGAEWEGRQGMRRDIRPSYLKVQPALRTVRVKGSGAEAAARKPVYLYGYLRCTPLTLEGDDTPVAAEWIVESVAEAITLARSWASGDAAAAERRANFWSTKAQGYRRNVASGRRGLGIALP